MTHTRGVVAAAAARSPVGVDIELVRQRHFDPGICHHVLTTAEMTAVNRASDPHLAFLRLWVYKEALVKIGLTTLDKLRRVDLAHLPLGKPQSGPCTLRLGPPWPDLHLLDWVDKTRGIIGAAVGRQPLGLTAVP
jgi:4'-phosphopantetheinyl transferase